MHTIAAKIAAKHAVRACALEMRAALTGPQHAQAGRSLRDALLARPEVEMASSIAAYLSTGTQPATRGLIFALWKRGAYVLVPRPLPDGELDWASYEGPDSLVPGPGGLLEPSEPSRGAHAIAGTDVVIVPALAVDCRGTRLGHGGGSYGRALARVTPAILTIGLLHDGELVDLLPAEPGDQRVSAVVTPSGGFVHL